MAKQTGYKGWNDLQEWDTLNNVPTGVTKPNVPSDPDYVAPVYDPTTCSPQDETYLFSTTSLLPTFTFTVASSVPIYVEARRGTTVIDSSGPSTVSAKQLNLSGQGPGTTMIFVIYPEGQIDTITQAIANDRQVTDINAADFTGMQHVEFRQNQLSSVNVMGLDDLSIVALSDNNLSTFGPFNLPSLEILEVDNNNLTQIDTDGYPQLRQAGLQWNNLSDSDYSFSLNPNIEVVWLAGNTGITVYDTSLTPGLTSLTLDQTSVSSIVLGNMPDLVSFDCTKCVGITNLVISANNSLTDLRCGECAFTLDTGNPAIVDAIIIKMDQNITSGGVLHYDALPPEGIQPTSASLAAYNSLVAKGCNLQGKVPA